MAENLTVKLEEFEGPLDLLLHLIKKHEIDLYNIRVASITDQYLASLAAARDLNLDVAGEFLVMAATLIYLKSRALLPPEEQDELEDEEPLDPEQQLIEQLLEHERFQKAGAALAAGPVLGRDVFRRTVMEAAPGEFVAAPAPLTMGDLLSALERVLERRARAIVHEVIGERLSIRDGIELTLERLQTMRRCTFDELFPEQASRMRIIVTFLGILELIKHGAVMAVQGENYGEINIELVRDVDANRMLEFELDDEEELAQ
ncbi:MAG: segregation/condensation protein A [Candidatus Binatia bacterium]|nr:segregation/condensation protein A [Candidatus Binatia bacterium]